MAQASRLLVSACVLLITTSAQAASDQYGKEHDLLHHKGSVAVIDFAASWCAPCRQALPRLEAFSRLNPSVEVVVACVDTERKKCDKLREGLHLKLPMVWDENESIAEHFQPEGMPATFVLDSTGKVIYSESGSSDEQWKRFTKFMARVAPASAGAPK